MTGTTVIDFLNQYDELIDVEEVTYKQWVSTDRTQLVTITEYKEDFIEHLNTQVFKLTCHSYTAKCQSGYMKNSNTNGINHSSGRLCQKLLLRSSG